MDQSFMSLNRNGRIRCDRLCYERVSSDYCASAYDCVTSENRCSGIQGNFIFYGRVTLGAAQFLPFLGGESADCDSLIDLDSFAYNRRRSYYYARCVIYKKVFADARGR